MKTKDLKPNLVVVWEGANATVKKLNPSGSVTIELRTPTGAYRPGDTVVVMPFDLKPFSVGL
jgi:hypothetical protein